jgi:hypothetical protein
MKHRLINDTVTNPSANPATVSCALTEPWGLYLRSSPAGFICLLLGHLATFETHQNGRKQ